MKNLLKSTKFTVLKQFVWDIIVNSILSSYFIPVLLRKICLRVLGIHMKGAAIYPHCFIGSNRISLGKSSYINRECMLNNEGDASIIIGDDCAIAYRVSIYTTNHKMDNPLHRAGSVVTSTVTINNGSWIGANSILLPGVTIGEGCVIAAGSVVSNDCEPNGLYAGVPAKRIKSL
jgi:maltose O-acetyltransferase